MQITHPRTGGIYRVTLNRGGEPEWYNPSAGQLVMVNFATKEKKTRNLVDLIDEAFGMVQRGEG